MTLMMRVNDQIMLLFMPWFYPALIGRWWPSWIINVICLTVLLSHHSDYIYKNSLSALIDWSHIALYITLEPAGSTYGSFVKRAQEMKIAAVKACSWVLHCECGRTTLDIKREGIMFKQRNVLCRSHHHCWTDEVISFSCMICNPTDQVNCMGREEKDRK